MPFRHLFFALRPPEFQLSKYRIWNFSLSKNIDSGILCIQSYCCGILLWWFDNSPRHHKCTTSESSHALFMSGSHWSTYQVFFFPFSLKKHYDSQWLHQNSILKALIKLSFPRFSSDGTSSPCNQPFCHYNDYNDDNDFWMGHSPCPRCKNSFVSICKLERWIAGAL